MAADRPKREALIDALHVFILCGFAVAQPLFDLLSRNVGFFVARHSKSSDVLVIVLVLSIFLPLLLVLFESLIGFLGQRLRKVAHWCIVAILLMAIALQAFDKIFELPGVVLLVGAAVAGMGGTVAYACFRPIRIFLTVLSPSVLIFPSLFLFNSPVFNVVFPEKDPSAATIEIDHPPPIIMIVFDEFPVTSLMDENRQIDPVLYPNFAALAKDSYWFRNASTVADNTHLAIPAILTGNYPDGVHLPTAAEHPNNLFTFLGGVYTLHVSEPVTQLCPERLCGSAGASDRSESILSLLMDLSCVYLHISLPAFMRSNLPDITKNWSNFGQNFRPPPSPKKEKKIEFSAKDAFQELYKDRRREFEQFIESIRHTEQPTLYFSHILLPHAAYIYLPSGKKYGLDFGLEGLKDEKWGPDILKVNQSYQRYLLQVGYVDTLIGKLIDHLKRKDLYEPSIIIITADHGVSFLPDDFRRPLTKTNYGDIMPMPLFIKVAKQQEGVISDRNVECIDILPTIADILGVDLPWETNGSSVFDLSIPERTEKVIYADNGQERLLFDSDLPAKYVGLKRKLALFESGTNPYGLFKTGLYNELVGKNITELKVLENARVVIELDQPGRYDKVVLESRFLPAQISGSIRESTANEGALDLAIAVNGVIWGVTRSSTNLKHGIPRFSAVAPEASFREGKNDITVFVVSRSGGRLCLEPTREDRINEKYSYKRSADGKSEILISSKGISLPIKENALKGYVGIADIQNDRGVFVGWAADIENGELPEAIVMFVNGKFFYSGRCTEERPDVAKRFNAPTLEASGFHFVFPLELFKDIHTSEIRFFAVSKRGVASELHDPKATYSLSSSKEQGECITSFVGKTIPVTPDALLGYMHVPDVGRDTILFAGWAADMKNRELPKNILVFQNGSLLSSGACDVERRDVAAHFNDPLLEGSGFQFVFPLKLFKDMDTSEIRFFAISGRGFASELHYTYSLSSSKEHGEGITSPDGKLLPVKPDAMLGYIHAPDVGRDTIQFMGWAADVKNRELPKNILVFLNGNVLVSGSCDVKRPDVVKAFNDSSLEGSGFQFVFPLKLFKDIDTSEIRFFAVSKKGFASELHYPKDYKWGKKS